jgi:hypothetical protein
MGSDGVTRPKRRGVKIVSLDTSLKAAHQTLRILRLAHVLFRSLAPIRKLMQRRKLLFDVHPNDLHPNFAQRKRNAPMFEEHRRAGFRLVGFRGGSGTARISEKIRAIHKYKQLAVSLAASVSHISKIQQITSSKKIRLLSATKESSTRNAVAIRQHKALWQNAKNQTLWQKESSSGVLLVMPHARPKFLPALKSSFTRGALKRGVNQNRIINWREQAWFNIIAKQALKLVNWNSPEAQHSISPSRTAQAARHVDVQYNQLQNHLGSITQLNTAYQGQALHSELTPEKLQIGRVVRDILTADARRPPSGVAAFDARSAPIWPGRKPAF